MKRFAPFVAVALSLAVVMPAAAASSGGFSEQFTVQRELTLIIQRDSVNYGTLDISSFTEPTQYMVIVGSGGFSGWDLTVTGSDFTGPGGATIPAPVRRATFGGEDVVPEISLPNSEGYAISTTPLVVAHADPQSLDDTDTVQVSQWIDLAQSGTYLDGVPDGDYTGTTTWNLSVP
ncbi:MAG TPA: hypothetical protein VFT20_10300 [Candidatus Limnocylindrales bacterium]|nr:hypothetical protein [Candidatus Limnocylindrales bacterium]